MQAGASDEDQVNSLAAEPVFVSGAAAAGGTLAADSESEEPDVAPASEVVDTPGTEAEGVTAPSVEARLDAVLVPVSVPAAKRPAVRTFAAAEIVADTSYSVAAVDDAAKRWAEEHIALRLLADVSDVPHAPVQPRRTPGTFRLQTEPSAVAVGDIAAAAANRIVAAVEGLHIADTHRSQCWPHRTWVSSRPKPVVAAATGKAVGPVHGHERTCSPLFLANFRPRRDVIASPTAPEILCRRGAQADAIALHDISNSVSRIRGS